MAGVSVLGKIKSPQDLRNLKKSELTDLAAEIRSFLVKKVSRTGGHLGPNLGVVELTIGLHLAFDSPTDPIVFDTGHQSYVHKILTGRVAEFDFLRQQGGLSGYPSRAESEHDWVENSHASTALSWAEGLAKAKRLKSQPGTVVAVVGDGSLTGGMAWEALNNIAGDGDLGLVVVVNDNGRSYTPTVGGLAQHLSFLRTDRRYETALGIIKRNVRKIPLLGLPVYAMLHGMKAGLKDWLAPQGMFSDLGIKYIGPIDGHDIDAVTNSLVQAKQFGAPVIVHCITRKGNGFAAAENNEQDHFHAVGQINELTGEPLADNNHDTWTKSFGTALVEIGEKNENVVALTAAMLHPTGLAEFADRYPDRVFDVGIAEQHAMTSAAGLAAGGLHPVFAVYATFLNRAFDQLLMDVALHGEGVTVVLDRSGVTGPDGASHNGIWDVSLAGMIPGLWLGEPRDGDQLKVLLDRSIAIADRPTVLRFSKERLPDPIPAISQHGSGDEVIDVLFSTDQAKILIIGYGQLAGLAVEVAQFLAEKDIPAVVVDPMWALPVRESLIDLVAEYDHVVTIEDNLLAGGIGERLRRLCGEKNHCCDIQNFGVADGFPKHGTRQEILREAGLDSTQIGVAIINRIGK
ncbi:MAG: 1-deoxy-D-xylulose-5-phosphate synthase [Propionibacterium sp.]|nr:MAG: 1-deoxy-D-xylulose-5-phosphate synthase [Propionibacterium sp.]